MLHIHTYAVVLSDYLTISNAWLEHTRILAILLPLCTAVWKQKNRNVTAGLERWPLRTWRRTCWSSWLLKQKPPALPKPTRRDILRWVLPRADYIVSAVSSSYLPPADSSNPSTPLILTVNQIMIHESQWGKELIWRWQRGCSIIQLCSWPYPR